MKRSRTADGGSVRVLRAAALISVLAGAAGSVTLTIYAGRHHMHTPGSLLLLFAIWVVSPFVLLGFAAMAAKHWSVATRTALHSLMLALTVVSLAIYGHVTLALPRPKTAVFVLVPPASWLLVAIVLSTVALSSRQRVSR